MAHRRRVSMAYLLLILLVLVIQQGGVHSQGQNGDPDKQNKQDKKEDNKKDPKEENKKEDDAPAPSPEPTSPMPTNMPTVNPFLIRRPLQDVQVRLLGTYDPDRRGELLDSLKQILQDYLYDAMVDYFQVTEEEPAAEGSGSNTISTTTITKNILYEVSLEWTQTDFEENGDPNVQMLQANGTLGFSEYDYFLLHPQSILPLQKEIIGSSVEGNDSAISLSEMDLALRKNNFFFEVLQFTVLENENEDQENNDKDEIEDPITEAPTPQTMEEGAIGSSSNNNFDDNNLDAHEEDEKPLDEPPSDEYDDNYYEEDPPVHERVGNDTIAITMTIVTILLIMSSVVFLRYLCFKSKQIEEDRKTRKAVSKHGSSGNDEEKKKNTKDGKDDPTADMSLVLKSTMSSSAGTPVSSPDNSTNKISSAGSSEDGDYNKDEIRRQLVLTMEEEKEAEEYDDSPKDLEAGENGIEEIDSKEDKKDDNITSNHRSLRLPFFSNSGRIKGSSSSKHKEDYIVEDDDQPPKDLEAREAEKDPEQEKDGEEDSNVNDHANRSNTTEEQTKDTNSDCKDDDDDDAKDIKASGNRSHSMNTPFIDSAIDGEEDDDAEKDNEASGDESCVATMPCNDSFADSKCPADDLKKDPEETNPRDGKEASDKEGSVSKKNQGGLR